MNNEGTKLRMSGFMESRTVCFTFAVSLSSNNDVVILRVLSLYETLLLLHTKAKYVVTNADRCHAAEH